MLEGLGCSHYGYAAVRISSKDICNSRQQIEYLCSLKHADGTPRFTIVAIDNRGVGRSTVTPEPCYPIQLMARDARSVLQKIGWWDEGHLHLFGMSMGGMISQELFIMEPAKFCSLSLASTTAGGSFFTNIPPIGGIWGVVRQTTASSPTARLVAAADTLYSPEYLSSHKVHCSS